MKKPIILLSSLLVLAVAAVLVGPGLVDWDRYKDQVTARIGAATGLRVAIDGSMDLTLLPRPTFKAVGVRIADLSSVVTPDMARVDALEVQVALMPLLGGDVQVQRVALLKPVLMVETQSDGRSNWSLGSGDTVPSSVRLERVNIQDGVLVWRDQRRGRDERVEDIDISLSAASLSGPMQVVGNVTVRGLPLTLDLSAGRVTAAGAVPMGLTLGLQGAEGAMRLTGIASLEDGFQGVVSVETDSLGAALGRIWPEGALPAPADQPFVLEASLRSTAQTVQLTGLTADFGDSSAAGTIAVDLSGRPHFDLALALNRVNLDSWMPGGRSSAAADASLVAAIMDQVAGSLPLSTDISAGMDIAVDAVTLRGALVRQARFEGVLNDGILSVSRLTAQLPGGSDLALAGTVRSDAGIPHFDIDAQAAANDLRGVLGWVGYPVGDVPSARLRRFSGSARVSGRPNDFQVAGFDVVVDGTRATGGLAYVDRGRPGVGLRLELSRINLDAYRAAGAEGSLTAAALGSMTGLMDALDANLDVTIAGLTIDGLTLRDIRLDATVNGGAITFREAAVGDAAGASLSLNGSVGALDPLSGADVAFTFAATDLARLRRATGLGRQAALERLDGLTLSGRLSGGMDAMSMQLLAGVSGGTVELGGTIAEPWTAPAFDLAVRARHPDLEELLAAWTPDYRPLGPLGPLDLFGEVVGTPDGLAINSLQGTLGTVTLAGHCRLARGSERPFMEAVLRTSDLDIDPWVARSSRARSRSPRRWSNEAFDLSILTRFDGSLALTATGLSVGAFDLAEPAVEARLTDGTLEVTGMSGRLFGGTFGASGRLGIGDASPTARIALDLVAADLAETLEAAAGIAEIGGTLDFGLEAETRGGSLAELVGNLSGTGLLSARDGQVRGIDLAAAATGLGGLTDPLAFLDLQQRTLTAGSTAFAALNATFAVTDGVALSEDLRLVGQDGDATGRGVFDLSRWQIDVTTEFDLTGMPDAPSFAVRLIGVPDDPERVLQTADLQAFIARRAAEAVTRRYDRDANPQSPVDLPDPMPETN